jgi:hypothetical protein
MLDVIVPAIVGVIQTSFERDHNSDAGIEGFERIKRDLPWIEFRYYDERSTDEFYHGVAEMEFSAIVYASNSLWNPSIFEGAHRSREAINKAVGRGMGIVVLQQFLPPGSVRDCDFLPLVNQVTYRGIDGAQIKSVEVSSLALKVASQDRITLPVDQFGDRSATLWSEVQPLYFREWRPIASADLGNRSVGVILRSRTPRARVIVSALPLDWLADPALLAYAIARAVRGRGTLYLHPEGEDTTRDALMQLAFGRAVLNGGHLARKAISAPTDIAVREVPYRHFGHFLISGAWTWADLGFLPGQMKFRLENEGSVTAHGRAVDIDENLQDHQPLLITVGARPSYLQVAERFASWFEVNQEMFRDAQTAPVRALATVADAITSAVEDSDAVPQDISIERVRNLLTPYIARRCGNHDSVDGHVLPTAAIASTMELLRYDPEEVAPLRRWIEKGAYASSTASLQQAKLWLPGLNLSPPAANTEIDAVYQALLRVRSEGHDSDGVDFLCGILKDPAQSLSLRAIVADALTSSRDYLTLAKVADSARTLQGDLERSLSAEHPPLEAVCLITATLIRIHAASGLSCGVPTLDRNEDAQRQAASDSALRRELELVRQQTVQADTRIAAIEKFARRAIGTSIIIAIMVAIGVYAFLVATVHLGSDTWTELTLACLVGLTVILTYVGIRASRVNCEPRWMVFLRDLTKR